MKMQEFISMEVPTQNAEIPQDAAPTIEEPLSGAAMKDSETVQDGTKAPTDEPLSDGNTNDYTNRIFLSPIPDNEINNHDNPELDPEYGPVYRWYVAHLAQRCLRPDVMNENGPVEFFQQAVLYDGWRTTNQFLFCILSMSRLDLERWESGRAHGRTGMYYRDDRPWCVVFRPGLKNMTERRMHCIAHINDPVANYQHFLSIEAFSQLTVQVGGQIKKVPLRVKKDLQKVEYGKKYDIKKHLSLDHTIRSVQWNPKKGKAAAHYTCQVWYWRLPPKSTSHLKDNFVPLGQSTETAVCVSELLKLSPNDVEADYGILTTDWKEAKANPGKVIDLTLGAPGDPNDPLTPDELLDCTSQFIRFPQDKDHTCFICSLCCAMDEVKELKYAAKLLYRVRGDFIKHGNSDMIREVSKLISQKSSYFLVDEGGYVFGQHTSLPVVIKIQDHGFNHAITVLKNKVFDSSRRFVLTTGEKTKAEYLRFKRTGVYRIRPKIDMHNKSKTS
jgi:hypothetical protein